MNERHPQVLDIEEVIRSKAGDKAKYIPKILVNWFKRFMHLDEINRFLSIGYVGVEFCEEIIHLIRASDSWAICAQFSEIASPLE